MTEKLTKLETTLLNALPKCGDAPRIFEGHYTAEVVNTLKRLTRRGLLQMTEQPYINVPKFRHTRATAKRMAKYARKEAVQS